MKLLAVGGGGVRTLQRVINSISNENVQSEAKVLALCSLESSLLCTNIFTEKALFKLHILDSTFKAN